MRFDHTLVPGLPRLAWGALIRASEPGIEVRHGAWVEVAASRFVEGAWSAAFEEGAFDTAQAFSGSGGLLTPGGVRFVTPTHTYEWLSTLRIDGRLFVSNSLPLLLAWSGESLDPTYPRYYFDILDHHRRGLRPGVLSLRLASSRTVVLHTGVNLDVDDRLRLTRCEKSWAPPPPTIEAYLTDLTQQVAALVRNAQDAGRARPYRPVVTLSQGYDSTAVAALARAAGCREGVTFRLSGSRAGYIDDSGELIGQHLGMQITAYEREAFAAAPEFREEEYWVEPWGTDREMAVLAGQLEGALLLTGRHGESVWDRTSLSGQPHLRRRVDQANGSAMTELRLRIGFLHFPPAFIGAVHAPLLRRWSDSSAMAPWSRGGHYDSPLARRLAEEAGVPGALFGQQKKGGPRPPGRPAVTLRTVLEWLALPYRPRTRAFLHAVVGNWMHPRWPRGSFEVQHAVGRLVERYRTALADG